MIMNRDISVELVVHFQNIGGNLENSSVKFRYLTTDRLLEIKRKIFKVSMVPPYLQNIHMSDDIPFEDDNTAFFYKLFVHDSLVDTVKLSGTVTKKSVQHQIENDYKHDLEICDFLSSFSLQESDGSKTTEIEHDESKFCTNRLVNAEERGPLLLIFQFLSPLYMIRSLMFVNKSFYNVTRAILNFTSSSSKSWNNVKHLPLLCGSLNYVSEAFLRNLIFNFRNIKEGIESVRINYYGLSISLPEYCIFRRFYKLFFELVTHFEWSEDQFDHSFLRTVIRSGNEEVIDYVLNNYQIDLIRAPSNYHHEAKKKGYCFEGERVVYDYLIRKKRFDVIEQNIMRIEDKIRNVLVSMFMNVFVTYISQNLDVYSNLIPFSWINSLHEIKGTNTHGFIQYLVEFMNVVEWSFLEDFMTVRMKNRLYCDTDVKGDQSRYRTLVNTIKVDFIPSIRKNRYEEFGKFITSLVMKGMKKEDAWILGVIYGPRISLEYYGSIGDIEGIQKFEIIPSSSKEEKEEDETRKSICYEESEDFNRLSYNRERDKYYRNNSYYYYSEWEGKKEPFPIRFMYEKMYYLSSPSTRRVEEDILKLLLPIFEISVESMKYWLENYNEQANFKLPIFDLYIEQVKSRSCVPPRDDFFSDMLFEITGHLMKNPGVDIVVLEKYMNRIEDATQGKVEWRKDLLKRSLELGYNLVILRIIEQRKKLGMMKIITDDIFEFYLEVHSKKNDRTTIISGDNIVLEQLFTSIVSQFDVRGFGDGRVDFLVRVFQHAYVFNSSVLFRILMNDKGWGQDVIFHSLFSVLSREEQVPLISFLKENGVAEEYVLTSCKDCGCEIRILDENIWHGKDYFIRKNVKGDDFFGNFMNSGSSSSDDDEGSGSSDGENGDAKEKNEDIFVVCKKCFN